MLVELGLRQPYRWDYSFKLLTCGPKSLPLLSMLLYYSACHSAYLMIGLNKVVAVLRAGHAPLILLCLLTVFDYVAFLEEDILHSNPPSRLVA